MADQPVFDGMLPSEVAAAEQRKGKANYDQWIKRLAKQQDAAIKRGDEIIMQTLLRAAEDVATVKYKLWQEALTSKNAAIKDSVEAKAVLPANYWQSEYKAYEAFIAAEKIYNATKEVLQKENRNDKNT